MDKTICAIVDCSDLRSFCPKSIFFCYNSHLNSTNSRTELNNPIVLAIFGLNAASNKLFILPTTFWLNVFFNINIG